MSSHCVRISDTRGTFSPLNLCAIVHKNGLQKILARQNTGFPVPRS